MNNPSNLNARLTQYDATARGETARGHGIGEIAGFAAAAGAGLAMAGAADAAIIYSGVQNISVAINPAAQTTATNFSTNAATAIDIDGGGADVNLAAFFNGNLNAPTSAKYGGIGAMSATGGAAFLGTTVGGDGFSNLAVSAIVGPGGAFSVGSGGQFRINDITGVGTTNVTVGNFTAGTTGFVGIRLGSGNYGWIRLRLDDLGPNQPFSTLLGGSPMGNGQNFPDQVTVIDWAYENSGRAIHVGDTSSPVPEPTPLALLAAGAVGIGAFRRRKAQQSKAH